MGASLLLTRAIQGLVVRATLDGAARRNSHRHAAAAADPGPTLAAAATVGDSGGSSEVAEADAGGGAGLKAQGRAAEKAMSCYGGDVSRLLDVCRARVRCAGVGAVAACLAALRDDPAVAVVRVKNWLSARHDPATTGGFRVREPPSPQRRLAPPSHATSYPPTRTRVARGSPRARAVAGRPGCAGRRV